MSQSETCRWPYALRWSMGGRFAGLSREHLQWVNGILFAVLYRRKSSWEAYHGQANQIALGDWASLKRALWVPTTKRKMVHLLKPYRWTITRL
jgi:hypothetical protein